MTVKETVQQLVAGLPDDVTWDEVQYRVYLRQVVAESDAQIARGEGVPQKEAEERLAQWLE
ncbi:MAG: hypothetical protein FWH27_18645 [Planctomycetaceae bacterium]|nr:hypothetical protein [Planctomycetaceae bacterium]